MNDVVRIAMWSGPRNISTALMRSFASRSDTHAVDEPFYAVYLSATGLDHPMRDQVIRSQSTDWREVVSDLLGPLPSGKTVHYQKHMAHHMLPHIGREWLAKCRNAYLIRDPAAVLASYSIKREAVTLSDIGIVQQCELFERDADRLGAAPPVISGNAILENPKKMLAELCTRLGIDYTDAMLSWPAGHHPADGVWAPAWYHAVEQSTGFGPPRAEVSLALPDDLRRIVDKARPYYDKLAKHSIVCEN